MLPAAKSATTAPSVGSSATVSMPGSAAMPALPGAATISWPAFSASSAVTIACSRAPEPRTRMRTLRPYRGRMGEMIRRTLAPVAAALLVFAPAAAATAAPAQAPGCEIESAIPELGVQGVVPRLHRRVDRERRVDRRRRRDLRDARVRFPRHRWQGRPPRAPRLDLVRRFGSLHRSRRHPRHDRREPGARAARRRHRACCCST